MTTFPGKISERLRAPLMLSLSSVIVWLTSTSTTAPTYPGGIIFAWLVCNGAKRSAIGGWLLFFYWQLYGGLLMTAILFMTNIQSYVPENFDSAAKCGLFLLSTVPQLVIYLAQVAVGTILLSVRTWDLLKLLRWLMVVEVIAAIGSTLIDVYYFPDNVALNFLTIIPGCLWLAYFYRSSRVAHVFKTHDWQTAVNSIYPLKIKTT